MERVDHLGKTKNVYVHRLGKRKGYHRRENYAKNIQEEKQTMPATGLSM